MYPCDYEEAYGRPEPSPAKIAEDKAKLAEFQAEANGISELTLERRRALGVALREYAAKNLTDYCYQYAGIEQLVVDVIQTANLDDWKLRRDSDYNFWLPSNFGC